MSDKTIIHRRREEFLSAFDRQDIEALSDFVTDDIVAMVPNRPAVRGKTALRAFWREGFEAAKSRFLVFAPEVETVGDLAVDEFRWTMDITPRDGGNPIHDEGKCIWIWRREGDGAWRHWRAVWNSDLAQGQTVWTGAASKR